MGDLPFRADQEHLSESELKDLSKERLVKLLSNDLYRAQCPDCGDWNIYKFVDFSNQRLKCDCGTKYRV